MRIIIFLCILAVLITATSACSEAGVSVLPDRHIVSLMPEEEEVIMYQIYNSGDEDIDIIIEPKAWSGVKDLYQWLSLESDNVYVKAGESTPLIVKLSAPENIAGEQVAMLFLCYKDNTESQLNIRNGVPVYMIVKTTEDYGLIIEDSKVLYSRKGDFYELNFIVKIKNTGNVHIVPDVRVIVKNSDGRTLNTMSLKRPHIVLRDRAQIYRLGWREPGLRDGIYKAEVALDYEDKIAPVMKEIEFHVSGNTIEKLETVKAGD